MKFIRKTNAAQDEKNNPDLFIDERSFDSVGKRNVPANNNTEKIIDDILKISPVMRVENSEKYSISTGSEGFNDEQTGNDLLSGNSNRGSNASAGKQAKRISDFKQKIAGKTKAERRNFAKELLEQGKTEEITDGKHQFNVVKEDAYNDDMLSIVQEAKEMGKDVGFFVGHGKRKFTDLKIDAVQIGNKVYLRYDGTFAPQTLIKHEDVHIEWDNPEMQKASNIIRNDLSEAEKKKIFAEDRYKQYMELYKDEENKVDLVWQEFVADVFAGMSPYSADYIDMVVDYWYDGEVINRYNSAEYINSIDAGGNISVLDNIGLGDEYSLSDYSEKALPIGSMKNDFHKDLLPREWAKYYEVVNRFDWDSEMRSQEFTFAVKLNGKTILSTYERGKPQVYYITTEKTNFEEGVLYDRTEAERIFGLIRQNEIQRNETSGDGIVAVSEESKSDASKLTGSTQKVGDGFGLYDGSEKVLHTGISEDITDDDIHYSLSVDAENVSDAYDALVDEYGAIEKGENPVRDVSVPKRSAPTKYVSKFARTMMEAGVTPDDTISEFERKIVEGSMSHMRVSDDASLEYALNLIREEGFDGALKKWETLVHAVEADDMTLGKNSLALGMTLYNQCVNAKDVENAMKIAVDLSTMATKAGQAVQAFSVLKDMAPDGQLYCLEKTVQQLTKEIKKGLGKKFDGIEINEKLAKEFLEAETDEKKAECLEKLQEDIASQIPSTWMDKWDAWRYLSMLMNPRTHFRNIVGNAIFTPTRKLKNFVGAILEKTLPQDMRTKAIRKSAESVAFAKDDFDKVESQARGDTGKYDVNINGVMDKRTIFKTRWLEKLRKLNSEWMETEDLWFLKAAYVDSFAQMMTAKGITPEFLNSGTREAANMLEKMRAYAVAEAQRATFRDMNSLAQLLTKAKRAVKTKHKLIQAAYYATVEGVMPFKNTPLNIAKRGIEYSPVSFAKVLLHDIKAVKNGEMEASAMIDDIAKGVTGTALLALGAWLFSMGFITGGEDEEEKKRNFDETNGFQGYSLVIAGHTYSIDWAAPTVMPLFVGVELMKSSKEDGFSFQMVSNAMARITDPVLELSCLQSLERILHSASYVSNGESALSALFVDAIANYFGQGVPTLFGQIARTIDGTTRSVYVDKNSQMPSSLSRFIQQIEKKIPFVSFMLQPKLDAWGREVSYGSNVAERAFENFASPGYLEKIDTSKVTTVLNELYEKTGDSAVYPIEQQKYFTMDGERINLTGEQYTFLAKRRGELSLEKVTKLINQSWFASLSDTEKVKRIRKCYEDAGDEAKEEFLKKYPQK